MVLREARWAPEKCDAGADTEASVFHAELALHMIAEAEGRAVVVQMDESFCNQYHCTKRSLVDIGDDTHAHAGKGPALFGRCDHAVRPTSVSR